MPQMSLWTSTPCSESLHAQRIGATFWCMYSQYSRERTHSFTGSLGNANFSFHVRGECFSSCCRQVLLTQTFRLGG